MNRAVIHHDQREGHDHYGRNNNHVVGVQSLVGCGCHANNSATQFNGQPRYLGFSNALSFLSQSNNAVDGAGLVVFVVKNHIGFVFVGRNKLFQRTGNRA